MIKTNEIKLKKLPNKGYNALSRGISVMHVLLISSLILLFTACNNKDVTVWVASPWQHVLQNTPPDTARAANLTASSNEYAPFRIIVHNSGNQQLTDLNLMLSNLISNDSEISSENIKLYRAHYVNVRKPSRFSPNPAGWYPDALIPFSVPKPEESSEALTYVAAPFSVDTEKNAEIWCDLYVPKGTKPGTYMGTATLTQNDNTLSEVPVTLKVWDFELPDKISMRSNFGGLSGEVIKMLDIHPGTKEYKEIHYLFNKELIENRAVPATPKDVWPEWNEKEGIIDHGESERMTKLVEDNHFNALNIPFRYQNEPEKCKAYLADMAKWLNKLGYLDISYVYLRDEPDYPEDYVLVRKQGAMIKAANPRIPRMCTEQTIPENTEWGNLYGAVDIWCAQWGKWDEKTAVERLAKGEQLWSYTALCQFNDGSPLWQIDMDPLNFRSPMWVSWHYDITGFLYWSSVYWRCFFASLTDIWEYPHYGDNPVSGNNYWGEAVLLYPGKPAGIKGFVPSIRLKLYREAAEDYEYMVLATEKGKKEEVNKIVEEVASTFQVWSHEPNAYEKAREQLAKLIQNK
ncbi:MAG: DUF4091 domain-containing protein [Bacteroidetes bacterium]|nr:DUF4091 domain-containing protein [Bacteroidota bacterium]